MKRKFDLKKIEEKLFDCGRQMFVYTLPQKEARPAPVIRTACDWQRILDERLSGDWADCLRS